MLTNYELPTIAFAGNDQDLCATTPAITSMTANTPVIGIGTWTQISGPVVAAIAQVNNPATIVSNLAEGTYLFVWTISNGVCTPTTDTVQIHISEPVNVFAGNDATYVKHNFLIHFQEHLQVSIPHYCGQPQEPVLSAVQQSRIQHTHQVLLI